MRINTDFFASRQTQDMLFRNTTIAGTINFVPAIFYAAFYLKIFPSVSAASALSITWLSMFMIVVCAGYSRRKTIRIFFARDY